MKRTLLFALTLVTLAGCRTTSAQPQEPAGAGTPVPNMPNPASVYCAQQGHRLEIRTAADGSQQGWCLFPDGSACDEWAYYRGECVPAAQTTPEPTPTAETTTESSGAGTGHGPGGYLPPGTAETVADWWGTVRSNSPGAQFDDCFVRQDLGQSILLGIDSLNPTVRAQLQALRDSGKVIHVWGTLLSNVPDCNGSQLQVEHFEVEG